MLRHTEKEDGLRNYASVVQTSVQTKQDQVGGDDVAEQPKWFPLDKHRLSPFGNGRRICAEGNRTQGRSGKEDSKLVGSLSTKSTAARLNLRPDEAEILLSGCKRKRATR